MRSICLLAAALALPVWAQTPRNVVTGVGYTIPRAVRVAPGQVITLFVRTTIVNLDQAVSADPTTALPLTLGGISASLKQTFSDTPIPIPMMRVEPMQSCSAVIPPSCAHFTAVTVQVPFELFPNTSDARLPDNFATIVVSENGVEGDPIPLDAVSDRIHVRNSCDSTQAPTGICQPVVLHADGSSVTARNPAKADELLTVQAYGLGRPVTQPPTGRPAPAALDVSEVKLYFRFGANVAAGRTQTAINPVSAQLQTGNIGIYQVSFRVPAIPDGTAPCSPDVTSNLTVSLTRGASIDGAGICVQ